MTWWELSASGGQTSRRDSHQLGLFPLTWRGGRFRNCFPVTWCRRFCNRRRKRPAARTKGEGPLSSELGGGSAAFRRVRPPFAAGQGAAVRSRTERTGLTASASVYPAPCVRVVPPSLPVCAEANVPAARSAARTHHEAAGHRPTAGGRAARFCPAYRAGGPPSARGAAARFRPDYGPPGPPRLEPRGAAGAAEWEGEAAARGRGQSRRMGGAARGRTPSAVLIGLEGA